MKILLAIHEFFPESRGGAEVLTLDTAKALRNMGHEITIFTAYPFRGPINDKDRFDGYTYDGFKVERFKHSAAPMGQQSDVLEIEHNNLFFASYFRDFLKRLRPDAVHFFHLHRFSASAIDACTELGIPVLYTVTDFWMICPLSQLRQYDNSPCEGPTENSLNCLRHLVNAYHPEETRLKLDEMQDDEIMQILSGIRSGDASSHWLSVFRALFGRSAFTVSRLNRIDRILVPTRLMERILVKNGVDASRICYQQYGLNMENFSSNLGDKRGTAKELRVGFIGALFEHKGAHLLIEAVRSLPREIPVELKIYGDLNQSPDYSKSLRSIASGDKRIKFCGTFQNNRIGKIFSQMDILVVPSIWYENLPLVSLSAQAAHCPIIATDLGGMSDVVRNEENGLLFGNGDAKGLALAIKRLAKDRDFLRRLSKGAKMPKSMIEYARELENYYREAMRKSEVLA